MDVKKCVCCGETKSIYLFNKLVGSSWEHVSICKQCNLTFTPKIRKKLEDAHIYCKYPSTRCKYSYQDYMCCKECPKEQYCEFACKNNPDLCGSKK